MTDIFEFISEVTQYTVKLTMKINWRKTIWAILYPLIEKVLACLPYLLFASAFA